MDEDDYIWFVSPQEVESVLFGYPGGMQSLRRPARGKFLGRELRILMRQDFS